MFTFKEVFRIGIYDINENFQNTYSDGTGGFSLYIEISHEVNNRYAIRPEFRSRSTGNVVNYGILSVDFQLLCVNQSTIGESISYSAPSSSYVGYAARMELDKYDNFTCRGTVEVALEADGGPLNDTIDFQVNLIIPMSREDLINIDLGIYSLFFFYFFLYVIIPLILVKVFKPVLGLKYNEDDAQKDEKFLRYIRGRAKNTEKS